MNDSTLKKLTTVPHKKVVYLIKQSIDWKDYLTKINRRDVEIVTPPASAIIESMRAYGYSLPQAIADLIDNSISAGAKNIWLLFHWAGPDSWVSLTDDGCGMSEKRLVTAMTPGSKNPLEKRKPSDLGRFGQGMKTASFSQCRRLTVKSLQDGVESIRRWDLDFIAFNARRNEDQWLLLKTPFKESEARLRFPANEKYISGTVVLWELLDRIVDDSPLSNGNAQRDFHRQINLTGSYLAMVFHRFLEGNRPVIRLFINGMKDLHRVRAWDPFLDIHPCTEKTPEEVFEFKEQNITVQGYILPCKDRLDTNLFQKASGPNGWNAQQGFYVYRNRRLLVAGSWLGLGRLEKPWTKEEHYKLARIRVDLPNSMDQEWQIDVKKSVVVPPSEIQERLLILAQEVRKKARNVFAHRGKYGSRPAKIDVVRPWISSKRSGKPIYRIDRSHPLVMEISKLLKEKKPLIEALLEVIEETVPIQRIWLDTAEKPDRHLLPFEHKTKKDIRQTIKLTYESLLNNGWCREEAVVYLMKQEEFLDYNDLIESLERDSI